VKEDTETTLRAKGRRFNKLLSCNYTNLPDSSTIHLEYRGPSRLTGDNVKVNHIANIQIHILNQMGDQVALVIYSVIYKIGLGCFDICNGKLNINLDKAE